MRLLSTLTLGLSLFVTAPAVAVTVDLGNLGPPGLTPFGNSFTSAQNFTDVYTFTLNGPANSFGGTLEIDPFSFFNVNISSVKLTGTGLSSALIDTTPVLFSFSNLAAGTYQLTVSGAVTFGWIGLPAPVGYTGKIVAVWDNGNGPEPAPGETPLPAAAPLFAAGLATFGFLARRRRRAKQA